MISQVGWGSDRRVLLIADAAAPARATIEAAGAQVDGPVAIADGAAAIARGGYDAVLADLGDGAAAATDALLDALAAVSRGVVLFPHALIDRVAAALGAGSLDLQCDADAGQSAPALNLALATARLAAIREEDDEARAERLRRLSEEMDRLARSLSDVARGSLPARAPYRPVPATSPGGATVDAAAIRALIRARRLRGQYFDAALFADPAWDMLLDLAAARLEHMPVAVSSLCIAAGVPPTTALRWIRTLTEAGLFVRINDRHDGRRVFIALSDDAAAAMTACLTATIAAGMLPM